MNRSQYLALSKPIPARGLASAPAALRTLPTPGVTTDPVPTRARARTPLTDLFPTFDTISAYFTSIPVDGSFQTSAGSAGVFGLQSVTAGEGGVPQEFSVFGVEATLYSPDVGAAIGTLPLAWGAGDSPNLSRNCAIIVGINLPIQQGSWTAWVPPGVPGISTGSGSTLSGAQKTAKPFFYANFPPGSSSTLTNCRVLQKSRNWAPFVKRVTQGQRLDVGFVVGHGCVPAWSESNNLNGFADVQISIGLTENMGRWSE